MVDINAQAAAQPAAEIRAAGCAALTFTADVDSMMQKVIVQYGQLDLLINNAGIIVNVAFLAGLISLPRMPAYSANKHFSVALTESVSLDLQETASSIDICAFCPGFVKNRFTG